MTFPHIATVKTKYKTGNKYLFQDSDPIACFLQPMNLQMAQMIGMTFSKAFICYVPLNAAINEGDRVTIAGSKYNVHGYKDYTYGSLNHKKLLLEQL